MSVITVVLFLAAGSTWMIELGGLQKEQLQFITSSMKNDLEGKEYMGRYVTRFSVDIPNSERAPPISAVAPLLEVFQRMGYSILSHNDEAKPNMNYLTWVLSKDL